MQPLNWTSRFSAYFLEFTGANLPEQDTGFPSHFDGGDFDKKSRIMHKRSEKMPYGRIEGEARERAEKELEDNYAEIRDSSLVCVPCTNSRRKAKTNGVKDWKNAMCKNHAMMHRIAYNTSPLSEAYWSS
jgi:hypothetical protein